MTNIEDLRSRLKVLLSLLENPEPGLFTWRENYQHAAANVLAFFGHGLNDTIVPIPEPALNDGAEGSNKI